MTESMIERIEDAIVDAVMEQELFNATIAKQMGKLWITGEAGIDRKAVAQAVILAMREPTEAMWLADGLVDHMHPTDAWEIMIDAALRWPPGSADRAGVPMAED